MLHKLCNLELKMKNIDSNKHVSIRLAKPPSNNFSEKQRRITSNGKDFNDLESNITEG